jgi:hypothetical protein
LSFFGEFFPKPVLGMCIFTYFSGEFCHFCGSCSARKICGDHEKTTNRNGCKMNIMEGVIGKTGRMQDVKWGYHGDVK